MSEIVEAIEKKMNKAISVMKHEFLSIRAGRVSPALFANVPVAYYGTPTPLEKIAAISVPEARLVIIQPWDKNALTDIEKAIQSSELSLNPSNDGKVIRIQIPPLSQERRQELAKLAKQIAERARVAIRNIRREANDTLKQSHKKGDLSEDEERHGHERIQKCTDSHIQEIDTILANKEREILEN